MKRYPSFEVPDLKPRERALSIAIPFASLAKAKLGDFSGVENFGKFDLDSVQFYAASRRQLLRSQLIHRGMNYKDGMATEWQLNVS